VCPHTFHQVVVELITFRVRNHQLVTHLRCGQGETVGHRHWQRLRVPGPGQHHAFAGNTEAFANRHHVGHCLTRMMHRGFEIDDRHLGIPGKRFEHRIGAFLWPVF